MKKKILALIAVAAIAMSFSGCKKDETKTSQVTGDGVQSAQTEQTAAPEKSADEVKKEMDNFAKDADKNVDMGKIDGKDLKDGSADKEAGKGTLADYEVEIKNAKLTDSENGKVVIVEYEFKNNTASSLNFAGVIKTNVMQDESDLQTAVGFMSDGYDATTIAQTVSDGKSVKVQEAYYVKDEESPVVVEASLYDTAISKDSITKTFEIK